MTIARAWLVGWNGNWTTGASGFDPGTELRNYSVAGSTFALGIRGYNQRLIGITVSYVINPVSGSMSGGVGSYEQVVDSQFNNTAGNPSGSMAFTLPTGAVSPNYVGLTLSGALGFQFTRGNPWSWTSTTTLTGTSNINIVYNQVNNITANGIQRLKLAQIVYLRIYCLNTAQGVNLARTACVATCDVGTSRDACGYCITCHARCATCLGPSMNECVTCNTSKFRILNGAAGSCGTNCICISGFYEAGTDICPSCNYTCLSCIGFATNCTSCVATRTFMANTCPCNPGLFDNGVSTCSSCLYSCLNCSITASSCTACDPSSFRVLVGNTCSCPTGKYDAGTAICATCAYTCLNCTGTATSCTACNSTRTLISGACVCNTGLYDTGSVICASCVYSCLNCTSTATTCTACAPTRTLFSNSCPCDPGLFDTGVSTCSACSYTCLTCSSNLNNCTSCNPTRTFLANTCPCNTGLYDIGVAFCSPCDYTCLNCTTTATTCTACGVTRTLTSSACPCNTGFYDNGVTICSLCVYSCLNCSTTATTCTACDSTRSLLSSACPCNTGFYDVGVAVCSACSYACLTCEGTSTNCTSCSASRTIASNSCPCDVGLVDIGAAMCSGASCVSTCLTCSSVPTTCTSCDPTRTMLSGSCVCSTGYFDVGAASCSACATSCFNCSVAASSCTACDPTRTLVSGSCNCNAGLYDSGVQTCSSCVYSCLNCSSTSTSCTTCDPTRTLIFGSCVCNTGLYDSGVAVCSPCIYSCLNCSGTATSCITCDSTRFLVSGTCLCNAGLHDSGVQTCSSCVYSCLNCSGTATTCIACSPTRTLVSGSCVCNTGLFDSGVGVCSSCASSCLNCSGNANNCTACAPYLTPTGTSCSCPLGKYDSGTSCLACDPSCATCTNSINCATCPASYSVVNGLCACLSTEYVDSGTLLCASCPAGCLSCSDALTCTSCPNLYQIQGGQCVSCPSCAATCSPPCGANYSCYVPASGPPSCSFNQSLSLSLLSTTKSLTANTVTFLLRVEPPLASLDGLNFGSILTSSISNSTVTPTYLGNGLLSIDVSYQTPLQNQTVEFVLNPQSLGAEFALASTSKIDFVVNPNNNLEADVYDSAVYSQVQTVGVLSSAVMYLGLLGVLLGLFLGRFIGVEMTGVVQVAFIGLMTMSNLHPLLSPLTAMGYITGPDQRTSSGPVSVPNNVYALQYSSELFSSLNYSMALLFLPLLVGVILFALSKCLKSQSERLRNWALLSLCDYEFTATMFLAYHVIAGTLVMVTYMAPSSLFPISIAEAGVFLIVAVAMVIFLKLRPSHFGPYKSAFKGNAYSQYHYIVLLLARVLEAAVLVVASGIDFVAFVAAALPVALIVLIAVKKPYLHAYNNVRAIINEVVVVICLGIYGYYRCFVAKTDMFSTLNSLLPYVVVGLLLLSELMNLAMMIKFFFDTRRQAKSQIKQEMEEKVKIEEDNAQVEKNLKVALRGIFVQNLRQDIYKKSFNPENVSLDRPSSISIDQQLRLTESHRREVTQKLLTKKKFAKVQYQQINFEQMEQVEEAFDAI